MYNKSKWKLAKVFIVAAVATKQCEVHALNHWQFAKVIEND